MLFLFLFLFYVSFFLYFLFVVLFFCVCFLLVVCVFFFRNIYCQGRSGTPKHSTIRVGAKQRINSLGDPPGLFFRGPGFAKSFTNKKKQEQARTTRKLHAEKHRVRKQ